jgi:hypothetical protein
MKKRIKSKLSTISSRVIIGIIRFTDLLLLFTSGVIANNFIPISDRLYSEGPLIIATTVASAVAALSLKNASAYRHDALLSLVLQAQLSIKPLLSGTCGAIIYLFLFYNDFGHVRMWPFAWMSLAVALIADRSPDEEWQACPQSRGCRSKRLQPAVYRALARRTRRLSHYWPLRRSSN